MSNLVVPLGKYTKIKTGKLDANASSAEGVYPFFTCAKEPLRISSYSYDCECVLVAGNGDLNVKYFSGKFDAYQRTYIIESTDNQILDVKYLFYFLDKYVEKLREQSIGGVIKYIKLGYLADAKLPLPSLPVQQKIAAVLDCASDLMEKRKAQIAKLDLLVKAQFVEMFGTEPQMSQWICTKIGSVADVTVGVVIKPAQYYTDDSNGVKAFRSLNIGELKVISDNWVYFTVEGCAKNSKSVLSANDVLIVRSGAPGTSCVITKEYEGSIAIDVIIARPKNEFVNPIFLSAFTNYPHGKLQIEQGVGGAAQQHFNVGKYKDMTIALPPMSIQNRFADFVQQVEIQKTLLQESLTKLKQNYKSLMQKCFRGECFNERLRERI